MLNLSSTSYIQSLASYILHPKSYILHLTSTEEDAVERDCLWGARHNHKMLEIMMSRTNTISWKLFVRAVATP